MITEDHPLLEVEHEFVGEGGWAAISYFVWARDVDPSDPEDFWYELEDVVTGRLYGVEEALSPDEAEKLQKHIEQIVTSFRVSRPWDNPGYTNRQLGIENGRK